MIKMKLKSCTMCFRSLRVYITCSKCEAPYHAKCLVKKADAFIDETGRATCCPNGISRRLSSQKDETEESEKEDQGTAVETVEIKKEYQVDEEVINETGRATCCSNEISKRLSSHKDEETKDLEKEDQEMAVEAIEIKKEYQVDEEIIDETGRATCCSNGISKRLSSYNDEETEESEKEDQETADETIEIKKEYQVDEEMIDETGRATCCPNGISKRLSSHKDEETEESEREDQVMAFETIVFKEEYQVDEEFQKEDQGTIDKLLENPTEQERSIDGNALLSDEEFSCHMCRKTHKNKNNLCQHKKDECEATTEFECYHCGYTTNRKHTLRRHIFHWHFRKDKKPEVCDTQHFPGEKLYRYPTAKDKSYNKKDIFFCSICGKITSDEKTLRHVEICEGSTNGRNLKCTKCNYCTKRLGNLNRHMLIHVREKPFKCTKCGYCGKREENLKRHMITHATEKPFKCTKCTYCAKNSHYLRRHMVIHGRERPFKCTKCSYRGKRNVDLKRHMLTLHGETSHLTV